MTPEDALRAVQSAAAEGRVEFASDAITARYDAEVQAIYTAIRLAESGKPPRRPIWTADHATIDFCLPWDSEGRVTPEGAAAVAKAGLQLGIPLSCNDTWADAALRLHHRLHPPAMPA